MQGSASRRHDCSACPEKKVGSTHVFYNAKRLKLRGADGRLKKQKREREGKRRGGVPIWQQLRVDASFSTWGGKDQGWLSKKRGTDV